METFDVRKILTYIFISTVFNRYYKCFITYKLRLSLDSVKRLEHIVGTLQIVIIIIISNIVSAKINDPVR